MTTVKDNKNKKRNILTYIIIGLLLGAIISLGYYFLDYQNKQEEQIIVGVSKEKILLADQNTYDLDVVLNSIISNQIVLQESIKLLNERISLIEEQINLIKEQENDDN